MVDSNKLQGLLDDVKKLRDELEKKIDSAQDEAKEEFAELENKYEALKEKGKKILDVAGDTAEEIKVAAELGIDSKSKDDIETAFELAMDELKEGYSKIKKIL